MSSILIFINCFGLWEVGRYKKDFASRQTTHTWPYTLFQHMKFKLEYNLNTCWETLDMFVNSIQVASSFGYVLHVNYLNIPLYIYDRC
jgi:hypothetical protein